MVKIGSLKFFCLESGLLIFGEGWQLPTKSNSKILI